MHAAPSVAISTPSLWYPPGASISPGNEDHERQEDQQSAQNCLTAAEVILAERGRQGRSCSFVVVVVKQIEKACSVKETISAVNWEPIWPDPFLLQET